MMLARQQRLRLSADIQRVYQAGRKSYHPLLRLVSLPNKEATSRATVVVSARTAKRATDRNRVKRRIRVALRQLLPRLSASHDIVVVVQPKAISAPSSDLQHALEATLQKQHLLV